MAVTITVGTNSYISLADAETYMTNRLYASAWTGSNDTKSQSLILATKKIDRQMFRGRKAVDTQTLEFPRAIFVGTRQDRSYNITTIDNIHGEGWYIETSISQAVKDATCEEALAILKYGNNANLRAELQAQGVKSYSLGNLSETFESGFTQSTKLLSFDAKELLRKYLAGNAVITC